METNTNTQLTILAAVIVLALLSVGAYLLTQRDGTLAVPDPGTLPATPAAPSAPPAAVQQDGGTEAEAVPAP